MRYLLIKVSCLLLLTTPALAQNITFDAKGMLFLTDSDMSPFAIMDGNLRKVSGTEDKVSTFTFPLHYGAGDQIQSDFASNSLFSGNKEVSITSDQKIAYLLESKGEVPKEVNNYEDIYADFPDGQYVTVADITNLKKPKSLYRFPVAANPTNLQLDPSNEYLAVTCDAYNKEIQIFELDKTGKPIRIIKKPANLTPGRITDLVWHPSGDFLVYLNSDTQELGIIKAMKDGPTGQIFRLDLFGNTLKIGGNPKMGIFTPDGRYFLLLDSKKEISDESNSQKGELYVVKLNLDSPEGNHYLLSKAEVDENPIGIAIHPEGNFILVNNIKRSFYPPEKSNVSAQASVSVLSLNFDGSIQKLEDQPIEGVFPSAVVFDKTGNNVAVAISQYLTFGYSFGGIEFFRFNSKAKKHLEVQRGKIYVPTGIHGLKSINTY